MIKLDLHTHSAASYDGGITVAGYKRALDSGLLDYIAVTDHNRIDFALELRELLGERIIVGEEIMTMQGEIIGLYMKKEIAPHQSIAHTIEAIKQQRGLVYLPHPFETIRQGVSQETLAAIVEHVDIIEIGNGRAIFQNRGSEAKAWAVLKAMASAASSDAHTYRGMGRTYSVIPHKPTKRTLKPLLHSAAHRTEHAHIHTLLAPAYHKTRKRLKVPGKKSRL